MESNRQRIIDALAVPFEELFVEMDTVTQMHRLRTARYQSLDSIGELLNVNRLLSESDNDYRRRIEGTVILASGAGTKQSIINYMKNYFLADVEEGEFDVIELSPNHIQVKLTDNLISREAEIEAELPKVIAAGIHFEIVYETTYWDEAGVALWDTDDRWR